MNKLPIKGMLGIRQEQQVFLANVRMPYGDKAVSHITRMVSGT